MTKNDGPGNVTLADVATLARVDRSVVSRVLNGDPRLNVRPETRQRVLDTVAKLGYQPNAAARSLRTARAYMYGLFIPDFANPVYAEIIKGAEAAASRLGYGLMTASSAYATLLRQGRVDGVLFAGDESGELDRLRGGPVPWLSVNRRVSGFDRYVILDDEHGSQLAVDHLVSLGHSRIGHVAGPEDADTARRRKTGYLTAMERAGLRADPRLVVHADYTPDGGAAATAALLDGEPKISAVFVANVASAVGCLHAAYLRGLHVPRDLSVVAVHDMALASHLTPALTTVRMPLAELGGRALELLASHGADDPIHEVVTEPVEVVVRDSTGPPPA